MNQSIARSTDNAVVLCADERYFPFAYIVCQQLAQHAQAGGYTVHLLTEPGPHLDRVPRDVPFVVETPDVISRLPADPELWRSVSVPPFACARLLAPDILSGYKRILYLDSDVRVAGSVAPLFALDMKGKTIGAARHMLTQHVDKKKIEWEQRLKGIGLDASEPFFNSGMVLIDADKWRRDGMTDVALDCLARFGSALYEIDQDCLNIIFRNAWLPLSPRWNWAPGLAGPEAEALVKPVVFHNFAKPWKFKEAPRREVALFRQMLAQTPYADFVPALPPYRQVKRYLELQLKSGLLHLTPFLDSSSQRLKQVERRRSAFIRRLVQDIEAGWYADIDQKITEIDLEKLKELAK